MEMIVLNGAFLSVPTKLQKVSKNTAKNSAGPNRNANFETIGARNLADQQHPYKGADKRPGKRSRKRFARLALLRHRIAIKGRGDRRRFARNIEKN